VTTKENGSWFMGAFLLFAAALVSRVVEGLRVVDTEFPEFI